MTGWNLPPGCTVADCDNHYGVGCSDEFCRRHKGKIKGCKECEKRGDVNGKE